MLELFEAQDLPLSTLTTLPDATPVSVAAAGVTSDGPQWIAVVSAWGETLGVVHVDAVVRLARRVPEVPLRLMPMERARRVGADTHLPELMHSLSGDEARALVVETADRRRLGVIFKEELLQFEDWGPLIDARNNRLREAREASAIRTARTILLGAQTGIEAAR